MAFDRRKHRNPETTGRTAKDRATCVAKVDTLNDDGRGVARVDGKVTFIDGAIPGERVSIVIESAKRHYDHARVDRIIEASPDRVTPECEHFGVCGGCSLQHLSPQAQIREKEAVLRERLQRFGGVTAERWFSPITGPAWHYRRSARLGVRDVPKKGGVLIGFRERHSRFITPLADCRILDRRVSDLLPELTALVSGLSCKSRIPQVEISCGDEGAALVFRHLEPLTDRDSELLAAFGRRHDIQIFTQEGGPASVRPLWPDPSPALSYRLPEFDLALEFRPTDFIQVNGEMNRRMVSRAISLLDPGPSDSVLDLFCGIGNFTLALARRAGGVVGVESEARLIQRARENAMRNAIANAEFRCVDLYDETQARDLWRLMKVDKVLLDPPRGGAMEVLKHMPEKGPERIVYVSCNPVTLARDAEYLVNFRHYRLVQAGVMDMFPHTSHVESMAVFTV
jgi:23S rRNA (uracil1939-C5)-methyltransferase